MLDVPLRRDSGYMPGPFKRKAAGAILPLLKNLLLFTYAYDP